MVTAKYLTNKWVKPLQDKFREEGRQEERQFWVDRERRRMEAEAKGIPFDEPYPGSDEPSNEGN